ncbi:MAG: trypsin-like peptidase domain-containing protein [Solirubrobacterales bacterium]
MSPRYGIATALAAALLAVFAAGCGDGDTSTSGSGSAVAEPTTEGPTPSATIGTGSFDAQKVYADATKGVVTVRSVFGNPNALGGGGGQGSGFVVTDDGEIVTNAHVVTDAETPGATGINEADEVFVEFPDRNQVPAKIVGVDLNADIALLKIEPDGISFEPLKLGDSDKVPVGEPVAAIGSPFGQEQSLSIGIISATDRSIESLTDFRIDGALQTDASINPGNSGGPLIDPNGQVIGVNQQINTTSGGNEGVGFAVPSNVVRRSIEDLRDDGKAEYAFIGVTSVPLYPQLADKLEIDAPAGSLIVSVEKDSPASAAGLRGAGEQTVDFQGQEIEVGGDVIVGVDGEKLVGESDLSRLIFGSSPGDTIKLDVIRDGKSETINVTLEARPVSIS